MKSFWKFAQSAAASLPFSVEVFNTVSQLSNMLWANEIWLYLSVIWVTDGYLIFQQPHTFCVVTTSAVYRTKQEMSPPFSGNVIQNANRSRCLLILNHYQEFTIKMYILIQIKTSSRIDSSPDGLRQPLEGHFMVQHIHIWLYEVWLYRVVKQ